MCLIRDASPFENKFRHLLRRRQSEPLERRYTFSACSDHVWHREDSAAIQRLRPSPFRFVPLSHDSAPLQKLKTLAGSAEHQPRRLNRFARHRRFKLLDKPACTPGTNRSRRSVFHALSVTPFAAHPDAGVESLHAAIDDHSRIAFASLWHMRQPLLHSPRFYPQQPPDLPSGLAPAGMDRNFCRQWSLQK